MIKMTNHMPSMFKNTDSVILWPHQRRTTEVENENEKRGREKKQRDLDMKSIDIHATDCSMH